MSAKRLVPLFLSFCFVISFSGVLPSEAGQGQLPGEPLTNHDIVTMVRAKISPEKIVARIKSSRCHFDTNPTVISELQSRGVPLSVIQAMLEAPYGAPNPSESVIVSTPKAQASTTTQREERTEPSVRQPPQTSQLTQAPRSPDKPLLPKRIRWSMPLCKEVDQQGLEVGTVEPAIARCDKMYVQGQAIRIIEGKQLYVSSIAGYYENYYVADVFIANKGDDRETMKPGLPESI